MSENSGKFDFCPKCGALARDGVCQSCGHHLKKSTPKNMSDTGNYGSSEIYQRNQDMSNGSVNPENRNGNSFNSNENRIPYGQQNTYQSEQQNYGYGNQYQSYQNANQETNQGMNQGYQPYIPNNSGNQKKSNVAVIAAITIGITIFAIFVVVIVAISYIVIHSAENEIANDEYYSDDYSYGEEESDPYAETDPDADLFDGEEDRGAEDNLDPAEENDENDPFLADDYVNRWGTNHQNHNKSEFSGEYYESICESIDETVDYAINREYYEYTSPESNVVVRVAYYQLEGDIPNIDNRNDELLAYSAYMAGNYFDSYPDGSDYEGMMELDTDSYVTYNDEKILSIVLDENWNIDGSTGFDLYGINVDLQNGILLENNSILDVDTEFASVFRERNEIQNGPIDAVDDMSDQEIADSLNDTVSSIIFYTPMGMEVGFNYNNDNYYGWVTVTFTDFEQYLKSF